jgi:hypothetical protein
MVREFFMRLRFLCLVPAVCFGAPPLAWADDISNQVETARAAYAKGDQLHALSALQAAVGQLSERLLGQFGKLLPPVPQGWEASPPELQPLDSIGGGFSVTQAYSKGESTLNVSLIVDNPTVGSSASMIRESAQQVARPGWARLKLGADDALLRFDPQTRAGEIMIVVGGRVLLQVEANDIGKDDVLIDMLRGWNIAAVRKAVESGS